VPARHGILNPAAGGHMGPPLRVLNRFYFYFAPHSDKIVYISNLSWHKSKGGGMKRFGMALIVTVMASVFSSCATFETICDIAEVTYHSNEHNGGEMWLLRNNRLASDELGLHPSEFAFDLEKFVRYKETVYLILIDYYSSDKLFISDGESLVLYIDDERMAFTSGGALDNWSVAENAAARMTAYYIATKKQLKTITEAKKIEVKIQGRADYKTAWFRECNIYNVSSFYTNYVDITETAEGK
jgi:hypothetical protein